MSALISPWGVYSVWRRHAQVFRLTWLYNCLPPMSEPIVYLVAFGFGLSPLIGPIDYLGRKLSYVQFLAPGMIAVGVLFQSFFEGAYGTFVRIHYQRTWQALLTAPLTFNDVFVADWLWAATRGLIAGCLTAVVAILWGAIPLVVVIKSLPLLFAGSLMFASLGMMAAGISTRIDHLNVPVFVLVVPMFALCGTYFPRSGLPRILGRICALLPLSSFVDLLRWPYGLGPGWGWCFVVMFVWTVLLLGVAWNRVHRKIFA